MKQRVFLISLLGVILSAMACETGPAEKRDGLANAISKQDWKILIQQANKIQPADGWDKERLILLADKFSTFVQANAANVAKHMDHTDLEVFKKALKFAQTVATQIHQVNDPSKIDLILEDQQSKIGGPRQLNKFLRELSHFGGAITLAFSATESEEKILPQAWVALHRAFDIIFNAPGLREEEQKSVFDAISDYDWHMFFQISEKLPISKGQEKTELISLSNKYTAFIKANASTIVKAKGLNSLDTKAFIEALNFAHTLATKIQKVDDPNSLVQIIKEEQAKNGGPDRMEKLWAQFQRFVTSVAWINSGTGNTTVFEAYAIQIRILAPIFYNPAAF